MYSCYVALRICDSDFYMDQKYGSRMEVLGSQVSCYSSILVVRIDLGRVIFIFVLSPFISGLGAGRSGRGGVGESIDTILSQYHWPQSVTIFQLQNLELYMLLSMVGVT